MPTPKPQPQPNPSRNPYFHPWVKRPNKCGRKRGCTGGYNHGGSCIVPPRG